MSVAATVGAASARVCRRLPRASLWTKALYKLKRDRAGLFGLAIVSIYLIAAIGVWCGWWATEWAQITGERWGPVSAQHWFGTNIIGQDIFQRGIYSTATAFEVGLVVAVLSVALGALLGAFSGFFAGTWVDEIVLWLMGVLDAMPFYLLVAAIAFALADYPYSMHVAMISTFWTTTGRLVRGDVIKLRGMEFVEAARAIGVPQVDHHLPPHPAQHLPYPAGADDAGLRGRHQGRGDPLLPRARREGRHELGPDDLGEHARVPRRAFQ